MKEFLKLKLFLDQKVRHYNRPEFIPSDPISIPHQFIKLQDIEISGFFAATLAWGNRTSILNSCNRLMQLMDRAPYDFVMQHEEKDLQRFLHFKHRTFNPTDTLYFIHFFRNFYQANKSLETAFAKFISPKDENIMSTLAGFHELFFSLEDAPRRTRKHIATPIRNSTCKRLNMFLRWMVRKDNCGVDFGLWRKIEPAQLICPCDVHVDRVARKLGLIKSKQTNWKTALELTAQLKEFDPEDPVKYDFALFGLGVVEKF
ncbi:MAG: TIGR02757 family protein [Chitinophagales bacterium]